MSPMVTILVLAGEYDVSNAPQMRLELEGVATDAAVLIDLTRVTYIDSSILGEFVRFQQRRLDEKLEAAGIILGSRTPLSRLFEVVHASAVFPLFESSGEAMAAGRSAQLVYGFTADEPAGDSEAQTSAEST